ncbi:MAG TPA: malto-oligosyltrehalose synthase [Solirubrobacteraceae bacterium]
MRATYRLQLGPGLTFADVRGLVSYLDRLGISHVYLSPALQARSGSMHGYDVVDPTTISRELGGEEELRALAELIGIVLDVVPNHMGTGDENRWWPDPEVFDVNPQTGFYRRFFDIDDMAAVRMERDDVFELVHGKVLELVRDGVLAGLRVDHPDGLADPAGYLRRLREAGVSDVWVEKILHPGEALRDWPVAGTVGYEFLNDAAALYVDPAGEEALTALWVELTSDARSFAEVAYQAQLEQATTTFSREVEWLRSLAELPAIAETLAALPVYRTYVEPWSGRVEEADREAIDAARPPEELRRVLALDEPGHGEFVTRFQQTSPPVTAKGVEDTAFYRYNRLLSLNEVGGDPARFGLAVEALHAGNAERARRFPRGLLALSTHDTKRSADVRARIGSLAGMAAEWREHVLRWRAINAPLRDEAPDAGEEYLLYQTLVGAWPISRTRLEGYVEKALREAKRNTSWVEQDHAYEERVKAFAATLIEHRPFLDDFVPFAERVALEGERHALGQVLLLLTSPGVPAIYQGEELLALSLVDPDNRRPVDWAARQEALERLAGGAPPDRATRKLFLIWRALALRARRPDAFAGSYDPVEAGPGVCAYLRGGEVLAVAPVRDFERATLRGPGGTWRDVLTGEERALEGDVAVIDVVQPHGVGLHERV